MEDYLTIGEISKLTAVPISTLRYYDSEGIFSPALKDEKNNYRYYTGFQIPVLKIIIHLKKLGFSNESIKSHLKNLNYSHTLELITKIIEETKVEIKRLQRIEKELIQNADQVRQLIEIEEKIDTFFIEKMEEIKAVYTDISLDTDPKKIIQTAFKKLDISLSTSNSSEITKKIDVPLNNTTLPIGIYALIIPRENIENGNFKEEKIIFMRDVKSIEKKMILPKNRYACLYCKNRFRDRKEYVEKLLKWIKDNNFEITGDTIIHFLAGPGFVKDPKELLYAVKIPIK